MSGSMGPYIMHTTWRFFRAVGKRYSSQVKSPYLIVLMDIWNSLAHSGWDSHRLEADERHLRPSSSKRLAYKNCATMEATCRPVTEFHRSRILQLATQNQGVDMHMFVCDRPCIIRLCRRSPSSPGCQRPYATIPSQPYNPFCKWQRRNRI